ncbi:hypothetical protein [Methylobacterium sp. B1]|uniref:hypothetical protein n=1 Tax=Methylobacterium sp. B1 TaxID=91459 RepID=UPI00034DFCD6|nr:hypothetical protein [Methylobacterium sp. B1]
MKDDVPEMTVKPTPFVDDLLDTAANLNPIVLMTILVGIFGCVLAIAPSVQRWLVFGLILGLVPGALDLRGRLVKAEAQLREAARFERGACAALQIAMARVEELEAELTVARQRAAGMTSDPLFRSVGLDADAPDYIVQAARRAHRVALHPDKHPPERRQAAHERYVAAEAAFDAIARRRGS